jgi:hypothetical protein
MEAIGKAAGAKLSIVGFKYFTAGTK